MKVNFIGEVSTETSDGVAEVGKPSVEVRTAAAVSRKRLEEMVNFMMVRMF